MAWLQQRFQFLDSIYRTTLNIQDDYTWKRIRYNRTNSPLLPANIRGLIIGKSNSIILFQQDAKNLNHIHADHYDDAVSIGEFKRLCKDVWNGAGNHNFVTIDLISGKMNGKYQIWIASTNRRMYKKSIKLIIGIRCLVREYSREI